MQPVRIHPATASSLTIYANNPAATLARSLFASPASREISLPAIPRDP